MIKSIAVVGALLLFAGFIHGQTSSPDPTAGAECTGTIKEYTPGATLVIDTLAPNAPMQFRLAKAVTYVDTDGKTIEAPGLSTNQKVRIHYRKIGADNVADRVTLITD